MKRWFYTVFALILAVVCGGSLVLLGFGDDDLPDQPSVITPDGASNREFRTRVRWPRRQGW
jgi:hypothetical protein